MLRRPIVAVWPPRLARQELSSLAALAAGCLDGLRLGVPFATRPTQHTDGFPLAVGVTTRFTRTRRGRCPRAPGDLGQLPMS